MPIWLMKRTHKLELDDNELKQIKRAVEKGLLVNPEYWEKEDKAMLEGFVTDAEKALKA